MNTTTLSQKYDMESCVYRASSQLTGDMPERRLLIGRAGAAEMFHGLLNQAANDEISLTYLRDTLRQSRERVLKDLSNPDPLIFWWSVGWVQQLTGAIGELEENHNLRRL